MPKVQLASSSSAAIAEKIKNLRTKVAVEEGCEMQNLSASQSITRQNVMY